MAVKRNARNEAAATLGPGWQPLVLEPSPPADLSDPYKADDPVEPDPAFDGGADATVVTPLAETRMANTISWSELVANKPELAHFAAERWLAAWFRLAPLPSTFNVTRNALHQVAAYLVSPARRVATGKIGLRHCLEGFGTPFYVEGEGADAKTVQIRVEGTELVRQHDDTVDSIQISTLGACGRFLEMEVDREWTTSDNIASAEDLEHPLTPDPEGAKSLAALFGFAFSVLEELRADSDSDQSNRPQIWPERFDAAIEVGSEADHLRAGFGVSPGDSVGPNQQPYLYVSPWYTGDLSDDFWNATSFSGAQLTYSDLITASDQRDRALSFFTSGRDLLAKR